MEVVQIFEYFLIFSGLKPNKWGPNGTMECVNLKTNTIQLLGTNFS